MPRVAGAARIQREVSLEILEPGHERAIERGSQLVELREQALLGIALGLLQPGNEVAAHFGSELRVRRRGRRAPVAGRRSACSSTQRSRSSASSSASTKSSSHAETAFGELIDQARRRDRSPRRFACGRRLLRRCLARLWRRFRLARFGVWLRLRLLSGAAISMVPRHFGEPQRQA